MHVVQQCEAFSVNERITRLCQKLLHTPVQLSFLIASGLLNNTLNIFIHTNYVTITWPDFCMWRQKKSKRYGAPEQWKSLQLSTKTITLQICTLQKTMWSHEIVKMETDIDIKLALCKTNTVLNKIGEELRSITNTFGVLS